MKRLLLPTDGSESSLRAAGYSVRLLAGRPGAEVLLLHVHNPVMAWEVSPHVTAEAVQRIHERAGHEAMKGTRAVLESAGVAFEENLLSGDPAQVIAEVAKAREVDGIVMGTRGLGPIGSLVLGSVATKVIHLAGAPVTLVK